MIKIIMFLVVGAIIIYLLRLDKESKGEDKERFTEYEDEEKKDNNEK